MYETGCTYQISDENLVIQSVHDLKVSTFISTAFVSSTYSFTPSCQYTFVSCFRRQFKWKLKSATRLRSERSQLRQSMGVLMTGQCLFVVQRAWTLCILWIRLYSTFMTRSQNQREVWHTVLSSTFVLVFFFLVSGWPVYLLNEVQEVQWSSVNSSGEHNFLWKLIAWVDLTFKLFITANIWLLLENYKAFS